MYLYCHSLKWHVAFSGSVQLLLINWFICFISLDRFLAVLNLPFCLIYNSNCIFRYKRMQCFHDLWHGNHTVCEHRRQLPVSVSLRLQVYSHWPKEMCRYWKNTGITLYLCSLEQMVGCNVWGLSSCLVFCLSVCTSVHEITFPETPDLYNVHCSYWDLVYICL